MGLFDHKQKMHAHLIGLLGDPDPKMRRKAAIELKSFPGDITIEALSIVLAEDMHGKVKQEAVKTLKWLDTPVARQVIARAATDHDIGVRREIVGAIYWKDASPLVARLRSAESALHRRYVLGILAELQSMAARPAMLEFLNDKDYSVRLAAVKAAAKYGDNDAGRQMVDAARDRNWQVRRAAAEALRNFGGDTYKEALLGLMGDRRPEVRQAAAASFAWRYAPAQRHLFVDHMASHPAAALRWADVILACTTVRPDRLAVLQQALTDDDPFVRSAAQDSLSRMG